MVIPVSAAPFFQEYDFASLNPEEHAGLIMERILAYGNRAELRWLVQTYGWEGVRGWVAQSGSWRLPWRSITCGASYLSCRLRITAKGAYGRIDQLLFDAVSWQMVKDFFLQEASRLGQIWLRP